MTRRIGVILCPSPDVNESVLKFLVLCLNGLQDAFEFEFLQHNDGAALLAILAVDAPVERARLSDAIPEFLETYKALLTTTIDDFNIQEGPVDDFVVVSMARLKDNYFIARGQHLSVIALGNWKRHMAPPSIYEFLVTLLLRESVCAVSPEQRKSVHLGTKGCLFDFASDPADVRFKVLTGYVCSYCRGRLAKDGQSELTDQLANVLGNRWVGRSSDPTTPAGIVSNMGVDLFVTKGLKPTRSEAFFQFIQVEGIKQSMGLVAAIILAFAIVVLGLKR